MKNHINRNRMIQGLLVLGALLVLTVFAKHYEYPDIQVSHEEVVVIPGLEEEYEFLFLTDLHLAIKTREDAGVYGDADARINFFSNPKGTVSAKQLPQWVSYANKNDIDAVLMGGDMIDYYSDTIADYLKEQIDALEIPYLFTVGNHEFFSPWEESIPEDSVIYELFQDKNKAFQILDYDDFVICAVDNEAYQVNEASLGAMRRWMEANPKKPMILLAHVPFYTSNDLELLDKSLAAWNQALVIGTGEGTRDTTAVSREFLDLILGEDSPVVAIFVGDNHFYHKGNLTDSVAQWVGAPAFAGDGMIIRVKGN